MNEWIRIAETTKFILNEKQSKAELLEFNQEYFKQIFLDESIIQALRKEGFIKIFVSPKEKINLDKYYFYLNFNSHTWSICPKIKIGSYKSGDFLIDKNSKINTAICYYFS